MSAFDAVDGSSTGIQAPHCGCCFSRLRKKGPTGHAAFSSSASNSTPFYGRPTGPDRNHGGSRTSAEQALIERSPHSVLTSALRRHGQEEGPLRDIRARYWCLKAPTLIACHVLQHGGEEIQFAPHGVRVGIPNRRAVFRHRGQ